MHQEARAGRAVALAIAAAPVLPAYAAPSAAAPEDLAATAALQTLGGTFAVRSVAIGPGMREQRLAAVCGMNQDSGCGCGGCSLALGLLASCGRYDWRPNLTFTRELGREAWRISPSKKE